METHPLVGTKCEDYLIIHTIGRMNELLKKGMILKFTNVLKDGNRAATQMESLSRS